MKDVSDIEQFIAIINGIAEKRRAEEALVKKYKNYTPHVDPAWDTKIESIIYNDISEEIFRSGLSLYMAPFKDVWAGIFDPSIYDAGTLWKDFHDCQKMANIIDHWINGVALTPIFLVKHGTKNLGLVADGKHRLTVARYMGSENIPFLIESGKEDWVPIAIPSATKI